MYGVIITRLRLGGNQFVSSLNIEVNDSGGELYYDLASHRGDPFVGARRDWSPAPGGKVAVATHNLQLGNACRERFSYKYMPR